MTKRTLISHVLAAGLILTATVGHAACYADYKAKQDNPLKLHYGVIELEDAACGSTEAAAAVITDRIGTDGWVLLNVLTIFAADGLEQRKESAGEYFLRY